MERALPASPIPIRIVRTPTPSYLLSGQEAVHRALKEVTRELVNRYYEKYGGLFVTRRVVERKVTQEINKNRGTLLKMLEQKLMCDDRPIQFNPRTAQVIYFQSRCLRTITVGEIASAIMEFREECKNS